MKASANGAFAAYLAVHFVFCPELLLHAYSAVADSICEGCKAEVAVHLPRSQQVCFWYR